MLAKLFFKARMIPFCIKQTTIGLIRAEVWLSGNHLFRTDDDIYLGGNFLFVPFLYADIVILSYEYNLDNMY
jgi:hypothetical protein